MFSDERRLAFEAVPKVICLPLIPTSVTSTERLFLIAAVASKDKYGLSHTHRKLAPRENDLAQLRRSTPCSD